MEQVDTMSKVPIAARVAPELREAIEQIAEDDDRSVSNVIERALKDSPMIAEKLEKAA